MVALLVSAQPVRLQTAMQTQARITSRQVDCFEWRRFTGSDVSGS
jgi:hypothetical protein